MSEPGNTPRERLVETGGALAEAFLSLLDLEIESLRTEMARQMGHTKKFLGLLVGAFTLCLGGALLLSFAAAEALTAAGGLSRWSGFAIVAGVLLSAASAFGYRAYILARTVDFVPHKTLASLRKDIQCLRSP